MSVDNFKPTLWSDLIFRSYEKNHVFAGLASRDYEGEISQVGDSVRINEIGDMSASTYSGTVTFTDVDDAQKVLLIDQQKYIAKQLDDVDNAQTKPKLMGEIARKMGIGISQAQDAYIAALYPQAGITDGSTGTPDSTTSANVLDKLSTMASAFDQNNVPMDNRVLVAHPWFLDKLRLAGVDLKTDNTTVYEQGTIANVMGWQVFMSNNGSTNSTWYAEYFFIRDETITIAEQIVKTEAIRLENKFGDGLRTLNVFGAKVIAPESLGILFASIGAES